MNIGQNQYIIVPPGYDNKFSFDNKVDFCGYDVLLGEKCRHVLCSCGETNLLLLGYAIDAEAPENSEQNMLQCLAKHLNEDGDNIADLTMYWGGRWAMFISHKGQFIVTTDCCGLKQIFYASNIFASQSRYVAKAMELSPAISNMTYIRKMMDYDKEYSWPLDSTAYVEIKRLLPNHLYVGGCVKRVQVSNLFGNKTESERIEAVSHLLAKNVRGVSLRNNLAVTLTAGWDSRLVLAACSEVKDKIDVVTLKYNHILDSHVDIQIPSLLCEQLGYEHKVLPCRKSSSEFVQSYKSHSENAHDYWIQMTQCVLDHGYESWMWAKGSCNEICRNSSGILYDWQVNSRILSKLYGLFPCEFSRQIIAKWLKDTRGYAKGSGYSILDLFYWEHRLGSWLAECLNEADVVGETFTPFNVRAYFELIKSVPINERISPDYSFFEKILATCGMDLSIPVNPHRYDSIVAKMKCVLKNELHILYGIILSI